MAFSLSLKSHEQNRAGFILFHGIFMGFLFVKVFFIGHEALNFNGFFHAFFMRFSWHVPHEKPMKIPHQNLLKNL